MAETIVSQSATWDPKLGSFVTTTTKEGLSAYPSIPITAIDVTKSQQDGVYRVTYKDKGDTTAGAPSTPTNSAAYNYEGHSSVSTEPLITFSKFASGGTWSLNDDDKQAIKNAEANPTLWKQYAVRNNNLGHYAKLILAGVDSYYAPTITLTITDDESALPNLSEIGKIAMVSNAPTLPNGGNWLFVGCNFSALQNGKWRISREYRASGRAGWNTDLYGAT